MNNAKLMSSFPSFFRKSCLSGRRALPAFVFSCLSFFLISFLCLIPYPSSLSVTPASASAPSRHLPEKEFTDISSVNSLYAPHIKEMLKEALIFGRADRNTGEFTGIFDPWNVINRAEFTKAAVMARLAEKHGLGQNGKDPWDTMEFPGIGMTVLNLLKDYWVFKSPCAGGDSSPLCRRYTDVADKSCPDDLLSGTCEPWYTPYILWADRTGFIKGYPQQDGTRLFRPGDNILRIHALKMVLAEDGNIPPENDTRFKRLSSLADSRNSLYPKCLAGAENYILANNGGNTEDSRKLLAWALLADRLDFFGNDCSAFGSVTTPYYRAAWLQERALRQEIPRWLSISADYPPINPDPETDTTINSAKENTNLMASASYFPPAYKEVPAYAPENPVASDPCVGGGCAALAPAPSSPPAPVPAPPAAGGSGGTGNSSPAFTYMTATEAVNMRTSKSAGTETNYFTDPYSKSHQLMPGSYVKTIGSPEEDWQKIQYYDGREAYIYKSYLKEDAQASIVFSAMENLFGNYSGYSPVRPPRVPCSGKYDWKLGKGEENIILTSLNSAGSPSVFSVPAEYMPVYEKENGVCGTLGAPQEEKKLTGSPYTPDKTGSYQVFEKGRIYASPKGTFSVSGNIFTYHENANNEQKLSKNSSGGYNRGTWTPFGFPVSSAYPVNIPGKKGFVQNFEKDRIFWTGNAADKAEPVKGGGCEYENYSYTIASRWPESIVKLGTGIAVRIAPAPDSAWQNNTKCGINLVKLDSLGRPATPAAPFAKEVKDGTATWKASFSSVSKSAGTDCEEQSYAVIPAFTGAAPAGDILIWTVGDENICSAEYWYTVIPGWGTKADGLWGGVFKEKKYAKDSLTETLFPEKFGDKYKELIVKALSRAEAYDDNDPNAAADKTAMILNYRTDRWIKISYTNPADPAPHPLKTGWVPVSAVVWKNDIFRITVDGLYIYDYYKTVHNTGYANTADSAVGRLLLHNTGGSTAVSLVRGVNSPPHYYFGRKHADDISAGFDSRFAGYVPEYRGSGTVNDTGKEIERKTIAVEMVNWEWANPLSGDVISAMDSACAKAKVCNDSMKAWECTGAMKTCRTPYVNRRKMSDGLFCDDTDKDPANDCFGFEKIKGDYDSADQSKSGHYTEIKGKHYDIVSHYFSETDGFFEAFSHNGISTEGMSLRTAVRNEKAVFDRFYGYDAEKSLYKLRSKDNPDFDSKKHIDALAIIEEGSDPGNKFSDLYPVLNKISFSYTFYYYGTYSFTDFKDVISPKGTRPFQVYRLANSSRAQSLDDGQIADYYERYTPEQYANLNLFISHMNEKYGIPMSTFRYNFPDGIPDKYGFYMYDTSIAWSAMKKKALDSAEGIISHRSSQQGGKMCPAPGFQIDRIKSLKNQ